MSDRKRNVLTEEKLDALRVDLELHQESLLPTTRAGDERFENACTMDHEIVTTTTVKDNCSSSLEGTRPGSKNTLWKNSEPTKARFQQFDVHGSVHLGNVYVRLKVQLNVHGFLCILYFTIFALHVSGAICTYHQDHKLQSTAIGMRNGCGMLILWNRYWLEHPHTLSTAK
jgi:hypothetical protein